MERGKVIWSCKSPQRKEVRLGFSVSFPGGFRGSDWRQPGKGNSSWKDQVTEARAVVPSLFGTRDQFPQGQFFHRLGLGYMVSGWLKHIACALYFYDYISSTSEHQALDPRGWIPLGWRTLGPGWAGLGGREHSQDQQKGKDKQIQSRKVFVCYPNKLELQLKTPNNEIQLWDKTWFLFW